MNKDIDSFNLKDYISSSKSVSFNADGCTIPSKIGRAVFDLSGFDCIENCLIHTKRVSGNGKVLINSSNFIISSKTSYTFNIEVYDKKIEIIRPKDSSGEIIVLGFMFQTDKEEALVIMNWKDLIKRCGKYSCLRLVGTNLYASPGAFIERGGVVQHVETSPPNCWKREGGKVIFNSSCEIINLTLNENAELNSPKFMPFQPRQATTSVNVAKNTSNVVQRTVGRPQSTVLYNKTPEVVHNYIQFDSSKIDFSQIIQNDKYIKAIKSNGKRYLLIRNGSNVKIPVAVLDSDKEYIIVITAKILNGNGKIFVGVSSEEISSTSEMIFGSSVTNQYISVKSGPFKVGKSQKLHMLRPNDRCVGEILISRIVILNNLNIDKAREEIEGVRYTPAEIRKIELNSSSGCNLIEIRNNLNDKVYINTKKYARYFCEKLGSDQFVESIAATSSSGVSWFNRMKSWFPKIVLTPLNSDKSVKLSISHAGYIKKADNIWIDAFDSLNELDIIALNKAKNVFSPSECNIKELKGKLNEGVNIKMMRRPAPCPPLTDMPYFNNMNYILSFDRNEESTKKIINSWEEGMPNLAIVGIRGNHPKHIIPINEFIPFSKLAFIIKNAKCVVDISKFDYESSYLNLALALGTPVVTNNNLTDKRSVINEESDLTKTIKDAIISDIEESDIDKYNEDELKRFKSMFES